MAQTALANRVNEWTPWPHRSNPAGTTSATLDAAGESITGIGYIALSTGPGTSKVLSSSGGKVFWRPVATITFANGSTNLRIGVQDVSSGIEDGTFDAYADLVGGTDTITAGVMATAIETGSKTIAHGDLIAISIEMTARGGADSVPVRATAIGAGFLNAYITVDSGSGPARVSARAPIAALQFDDGTMGWIYGTVGAWLELATTFGTGSTPDEYALIFTVPVPTSVVGIFATLDNVASGDTFEFVLYSDPTGTPSAQRSVTLSPDVIQGATDDGQVTGLFTSAYSVAAGTTLAVSVRPTSAATITLSRLQFGSGNGALRGVTQLGTNWSEGTRSDNTGAFSSNTENLPCIGFIVQSFADDTGGGVVTDTQIMFIPMD